MIIQQRRKTNAFCVALMDQFPTVYMCVRHITEAPSGQKFQKLGQWALQDFHKNLPKIVKTSFSSRTCNQINTHGEQH